MASKYNSFDGGTDGNTIPDYLNSPPIGDGDAWDYVSTLAPYYEASPVAQGALCCRFPSGTGAEDYLSWTTFNSAYLSTQFWFYAGQYPTTTDQRLFAFRNTANIGGLLFRADGTIRVMENTSGYTLATSSALSTSTWYLINFVLRQSGTTADYDVEIWTQGDFVTPHWTYYGGHAFTPTNTSNLTAIRLGRILSTADFGGAIYVDEVRTAEQNTVLDFPSTATPLTITAITNLIG